MATQTSPIVSTIKGKKVKFIHIPFQKFFERGIDISWTWQSLTVVGNVLICVEKRKKIRVHKISICACTRYATQGRHGRNVYICYKRESFLEIFARFLCHNHCLCCKCIFRSQIFSKWSTICAKSLRTPKKPFQATLEG